MKNQALFSSKDKSKKLKCHLLQFLFGALRVNTSSFALYLCLRHPRNMGAKDRRLFYTLTPYNRFDFII